MEQNNLDIRVVGQEVESGLFQMTLNTSDRAIGDVEAESVGSFFDAAAKAIQAIHPEKSIVVTVVTLDGDVRESSRYFPRLDSVA